MKTKRSKVDQKLRDLLLTIYRAEGSYAAMATRTDTSLDTYARVLRGAGGMSGESARKLTAAYGKQFAFTENQVRQWLGLEPADGAESEESPDDDDPLKEARVAFELNRQFLTSDDAKRRIRDAAAAIVRGVAAEERENERTRRKG